jgi:hypothetical protein
MILPLFSHDFLQHALTTVPLFSPSELPEGFKNMQIRELLGGGKDDEAASTTTIEASRVEFALSQAPVTRRVIWGFEIFIQIIHSSRRSNPKISV